MGLGTTEWMIILAIVVLLFGAKKIPELAKGIGSGIKSFKKEMAEDEVVATSNEKKVSDNSQQVEVKKEEKKEV